MIASIQQHRSNHQKYHGMSSRSRDGLSYLSEGYRSYLETEASMEPHLAQALEYILSTEGRLMRAQLGFAAMRACGSSADQARRFGIAIEYFHTASLLFDDLPCMDAATHRRGRLCAHIKFSEADAILAALALITGAYDLLFSNLSTYPAPHAAAARKLMTECLGARGIISGQSADLHYPGAKAQEADILEIASGKTGTLLCLLLGFPARLHGRPADEVSVLEKLALQWGQVYQVLDDLKDCLESNAEAGKTVRRDEVLVRPNYMIKAGTAQAVSFVEQTLSSSRSLIQNLVSTDSAWSVLQRFQDEMDAKAGALGTAAVVTPAC